MNGSVIVLLALIGLAASQSCPNCPPPVIPPNCGAPDCNLPENQQNIALFPHPDPNFYWQCMPGNPAQGWIPVERLCACGTVFNPNESPPRCTFWFDRSWQPICQWTRPPTLRPCDPWCPDCGDDLTPEPETTTTQAPPTTPSQPTVGITTTTNGNGNPIETTTPSSCGCPPSCPPCIWWPCWPCTPCWCKRSLVNSRNYKELTME